MTSCLLYVILASRRRKDNELVYYASQYSNAGFQKTLAIHTIWTKQLVPADKCPTRLNTFQSAWRFCPIACMPSHAPEIRHSCRLRNRPREVHNQEVLPTLNEGVEVRFWKRSQTHPRPMNRHSIKLSAKTTRTKRSLRWVGWK